MANKNDLVVLGLLFEQDRYGYEIRQEMSERHFEHWANINTASIYNHLNRLEESGALSSHTERVGRHPERKVYSLTEEGRRQLSDMVLEAIASISYSDHTLAPLGLGFVYCADQDAVLRATRARIAGLGKVIEYLEARTEWHRGRIPLNWMLVMEGASNHIRVELDTFRKLEKAIESGALAESIEQTCVSGSFEPESEANE